MSQINQLTVENQENVAKLSTMSATSPELYLQLTSDVDRLVSAINLHTVNLVEMVSYIQKLSPVSLTDIQKEFGFNDEDMDDC